MNDLPPGEWHFRRALELAGPHAPYLLNLGHQPAASRDGRTKPMVILRPRMSSHRRTRRRSRTGRLCTKAAAISSARSSCWRRPRPPPRPSRSACCAPTTRRAPARTRRRWRSSMRPRTSAGMPSCSAAGCASVPGATRRPGRTSSTASASWRRRAAGASTSARRSRRCLRCAGSSSRATPGPRCRALRYARDLAQPIFVIGFPRSGTTLVEQILCSHSRVRPGGELPFIEDLQRLAAGAVARPRALSRQPGPQLYRRPSLRGDAVPRLLPGARRAVRTAGEGKSLLHRQDALQRDPPAAAEDGVPARQDRARRAPPAGRVRFDAGATT